jgi:hypothetical protein
VASIPKIDWLLLLVGLDRNVKAFIDGIVTAAAAGDEEHQDTEQVSKMPRLHEQSPDEDSADSRRVANRPRRENG